MSLILGMAKLKEKITAQNERLSKLKQSTQKRITALREAARRSELTLPVQVALRFALACEPFREVLRAESYVGHGVQMLGREETNDVCHAREGFGIAVRHPHSASGQ